jgi:protein-S-isoprenylcysteine O-methyltransferase Ste14
MTASIAKFLFVAMAVGWYFIRYRYARRARREKVAKSARGSRENTLLLVSLAGLGIMPFVYILTGAPHFASYTFRPIQGWLGGLTAVAALVMFRLTHRALGRNWSISLDVRENHRLVTSGIYRRIRHPMYTAFWLWAVAQALLLPNIAAGFAGMIGFGILYFGRVSREEHMMTETFGDEYREYMGRTGRLIPRVF